MKFKYTLFSIFFVSCSIDVDSIKSSSDLKKTSVIEFDVFPQNSGRIIDQFSCVGWNELIGCPLSLESYHNNSNVELTAIPTGNFKFFSNIIQLFLLIIFNLLSTISAEKLLLRKTTCGSL